MGLFDVNKQFLQQRLPGLDVDYALLSEALNLDLAHLQLLNDCQHAWQNLKLPDEFWMYALLLVDEINRGSSCLDMHSQRFQHHQKQFKLPDWSTLNLDMNDLMLAQQAVFVYQHPYLYFEKYHHAEQRLEQQIKSLIDSDQERRYSNDDIKSSLETVLKTLEYPLNQEQIQAVITALVQPFSLVSGGPGTGKTTMVSTLLRCLHSLGVSADDMALAAPTGRAAYRMTESLQFGLNHSLGNESDHALKNLEAQTIHRLIGKSSRFNQPNRFHSQHTLPYQVIVVDEVSMVDLQLMTELLAAVADNCRLILVGDQFQLPSVESGAVLADLMPPQSHSLTVSEGFATVLSELMAPFVDEPIEFTTDDSQSALLADTCTVLRQSHRSVKSIQNISECVRIGDADGFFNQPDLNQLSHDKVTAPKKGVMWMPQHNNSKAGLALIWAWFKDHIDLEQYHKSLQFCLHFDPDNIAAYQADLAGVFQHINRQKILTLVNQGMAGQALINRHLCQQIKHQWQIDAGLSHFHGQVVMIQRNDYDKQLFNGDIGVILRSNQGWQAVFPGQDTYRSFALPLLPELTTAFAITVHKSQGSEYKHVMMPLPADKNNRLLSREIIYTGMTRAKSSVFIYANKAVLKQAITHHSERQSGLQFW